jgi:hypothetical protein
MCQTSWELTDGRRAFVVTFGRPDLDAPRRYSIRQGRLELEHEAAEVDTVILARVIDEALYPHVAPAMRIRALVDTCRTALAAYPPDGFEPVDEDRDDPAVLLACLPASLVVLLEAEVSRHFEGIDVERLCEVLENDLSKDIPVVRLIRRYVVVPADSLS